MRNLHTYIFLILKPFKTTSILLNLHQPSSLVKCLIIELKGTSPDRRTNRELEIPRFSCCRVCQRIDRSAGVICSLDRHQRLHRPSRCSDLCLQRGLGWTFDSRRRLDRHRLLGNLPMRSCRSTIRVHKSQRLQHLDQQLAINLSESCTFCYKF